jgi:cytochrome c-type biogenesis protein CcmH/NrfG
VLLGRILLRLSRPAEARAALERALALGASRLSVLPWLAEAAFRERRFADVRAALSALDLRFLGRSPLLRARSFWG